MAHIKKPTEDDILSYLSEMDLQMSRDTDSGRIFCRIPVGSGFEYALVQSDKTKGYVLCQIRDHFKSYTSERILKSVIDQLEFERRFNSQTPSIKMANRVASDINGDYLYDLANEEGQCVRIDENGWSIQSNTFAFRRYEHSLPQVIPIPGGVFNDLFNLLNVKPEDHLLLTTWIISAFVPNIQHPILLLTGPHGSTKSVLTQFLREIIDPSAIGGLSTEQKFEDVRLAASQSFVMSFDNERKITDSTADFLCRAVTGSSEVRRAHYENEKLIIWNAKTRLIINGISVLVKRSDLASRMLWLELEKPKHYKGGIQLHEEFEKAKPKILGAVFDILVETKKLLSEINQESLERLTDFNIQGRAITQAIGKSEKAFSTMIRQNKERLLDQLIQQDPVAPVVIAFMRDRDFKSWEGTSTQLLAELNKSGHVNSTDKQYHTWPSDSSKLSRKLDELSDDLIAYGICFIRGHKGSRRFIELSPVPENVTEQFQISITKPDNL